MKVKRVYGYVELCNKELHYKYASSQCVYIDGLEVESVNKHTTDGRVYFRLKKVQDIGFICHEKQIIEEEQA